MDLGLKGKRALVMGSSKGLGRATAEALAAEGANLVISGRNLTELEAQAGQMRAAFGTQVYAVAADVGRLAEMDRLADAAMQAMDGVDILVLNHGGPPVGLAVDLKEEQLVEQFQKMVVAPVRIASRLLPQMRARQWGRILTVGSSGMKQPLPNMVLSNTLRAAIVGWNKTLATELAPEGITCNILAPGSIRTDRTLETAGAAARKRGVPIEQIFKEREAAIPMGRFGRIEEYGAVAAFLCSEKASYITGSVVRCDGGIIRGV